MVSSSRHIWLPLELGEGRVQRLSPSDYCLSIPAKAAGYADAQLDDYRSLARSHFPWRPPVRMSLRACSSTSAPLGTLGFGFWNDPFGVSLGGSGSARRLPAPPQAIWFFFASPPNDFSFAPGMPGYGWRAMTLKSPSISPLLFSLLAGLALGLTRISFARPFMVRRALGAVKAAEQLIHSPLHRWHRFRIEWDSNESRFLVDDHLVLRASIALPGPLGFVAWIDNQYAIATPDKGFHFGILPTQQQQKLMISQLQIASL